MKLFSSLTYQEKKTLFIPLFLFLLITFFEIVTILLLNSGLIVHTLDDAYIHLALAENILKGHYGVNLGEYSSPSSSIIWPFFLAPFSGFSFGHIVPLIINVCSATGTLLIFWLVIKSIFRNETADNQRMNKAVILFTILLIFATNLVSTMFGGMEHSLQVFFTVLIIWGLIKLIQEKQISRLLVAAVIIAPLVRYENLALSFAALFFLYIYGYKRAALLSFILIAVIVGGFSVFLLNLGLDPLPLSVYEKSKVVSAGGSIPSLLENLRKNIFSPRLILLIICTFFLFYKTLSNKKSKGEKLFAVCIALAILLHLVVGKPGRYITYIWAASVLSILYLYREWLIEIITKNSLLKTALAVSIIVAFLSYKYISGIVTVPIASNNIYEQQYQMHRFVTEYYKNPVAVNDLGYVSYRNDYYVMDLVGLASIEALNYWRANDKSDWIDTISKKHNVKLAMVYDDWFNRIPGSWYKVAELYLGKIKISPSNNIVSFYLIDKRIKNEAVASLKSFKETLPGGVKLLIWD